MKKGTLFHLATCSTCQRIIKDLELGSKMNLQDIKTVSITKEQLERMKKLSGSYESLFSRRAMKFRSMGLHEKKLSEQDYKDLILSEYTFLKRPVALFDEKVFIGNAKKEVETLHNYMLTL